MNHINQAHTVEYIRSLLPERGEEFLRLEAYAEENHIPIIEPEVAQFLGLLLKIHRPKKILEIGTAIGYSALVMAHALEGDCHIWTIERRADMVDLAKENIGKSPYGKKITILEGDGEEILASLDEKFDLIFMDAAKGQYIEFFNHCKNLLNPAGIIISDNVLFRGMVSSQELLIRRKITIVKRLRKYLPYINQIEGFHSSIIPIGDGMAISYKEEETWKE